MEIYLTKRYNKLIPTFESDLEALKKIKDGDNVLVKVSRPRNYQFLKKFFALLNLAFHNQDQFDNFEKFRFVMIMKAGHFEAIDTGKGVVYMPKSISFGKMDETEFERLYNDMIQAVIDLLQIDEDTIKEELINFM